MTRASTSLHACQYIALICMYVRVLYYGYKRDVFNQHYTQHTDSYGCVRMHANIHLAFKELSVSGRDLGT